jgi:hypothetical protein
MVLAPLPKGLKRWPYSIFLFPASCLSSELRWLGIGNSVSVYDLRHWGALPSVRLGTRRREHSGRIAGTWPVSATICYRDTTANAWSRNSVSWKRNGIQHPMRQHWIRSSANPMHSPAIRTNPRLVAPCIAGVRYRGPYLTCKCYLRTLFLRKQLVPVGFLRRVLERFPGFVFASPLFRLGYVFSMSSISPSLPSCVHP